MINIRQNYKQYISLIIDNILYKIRFKANKHYDLVVVRSDAIGDFIIWISALKSYRKKFSNQTILLICPEEVEMIAKKLGYFDQVISFNKKKFENNIIFHLQFMLKMKSYYSGIVINPAWAHQRSADYICSMIQSPRKIGIKTKRIGIRDSWCDKYFNELIELKNAISEFDSVELFTQKIIDTNFKYTLSDLNQITKDYTSPISSKYCLIALSSSTEEKNWPIENLLKVIECIPSEFQIVLSGYGLKDNIRAQYLIREDNNTHIVHNYVNKTSVPQLIGFISKSKFVLGNDSAAVHIAAACRVPSICYTHGAFWGKFVPYPDEIPEKLYHPRCVYYQMECFGCEKKCIKETQNENTPLLCLRMVSSDMVKQKLIVLLEDIIKINNQKVI